jgi:hypothetical protein
MVHFAKRDAIGGRMAPHPPETRFWIAVAVILPVATLAVLFLLFPRGDSEEPLLPPRGPAARDSGAASPPGSGAAPGAPDANAPGPARSPAPPGTAARDPGGATPHPLLGTAPAAGSAAETAAGQGPLTPEDIERARDENVRKVAENAREMRKRERQMFEDIMGPLEEEKAQSFLDLYYGYYDEASKEYRGRIERGESPDRDAVYSEVRRRTYEKMEKVLDPAQMGKFRAWWEEKCFPKKD